MKHIINFPGLSLNEVRSQFPALFCRQDWYNSESFANVKIPAGKYEVNLETVADSFSKTWDEQQELLQNGEAASSAAVLAYAICKSFEETGHRAFENIYARCSDLDSDGYRVFVGRFGAGGLHVNDGWDSFRRSYVGLASARKIESLSIEPSDSLSSDFETRIAALEVWRERVQMP